MPTILQSGAQHCAARLLSKCLKITTTNHACSEVVHMGVSFLGSPHCGFPCGFPLKHTQKGVPPKKAGPHKNQRAESFAHLLMGSNPSLVSEKGLSKGLGEWGGIGPYALWLFIMNLNSTPGGCLHETMSLSCPFKRAHVQITPSSAPNSENLTQLRQELFSAPNSTSSKTDGDISVKIVEDNHVASFQLGHHHSPFSLRTSLIKPGPAESFPSFAATYKASHQVCRAQQAAREKASGETN